MSLFHSLSASESLKHTCTLNISSTFSHKYTYALVPPEQKPTHAHTQSSVSDSRIQSVCSPSLLHPKLAQFYRIVSNNTDILLANFEWLHQLWHGLWSATVHTKAKQSENENKNQTLRISSYLFMHSKQNHRKLPQNSQQATTLTIGTRSSTQCLIFQVHYLHWK